MMRWTDEPGEWKDQRAYGRWCMVGGQFDGVTTVEVGLSRVVWHHLRRESQLKVRVQVRDARLTSEQARRLAQVLLDAANQLDEEDRFRRGMAEALAEEEEHDE